MVFATVLPVINQPLSQIAVVIGALYGLPSLHSTNLAGLNL